MPVKPPNTVQCQFMLYLLESSSEIAASLVHTGNGCNGAQVAARAVLQQESDCSIGVGPTDLEGGTLNHVPVGVGQGNQGQGLRDGGRKGDKTSCELHFGGYDLCFEYTCGIVM